MTRIAFAVAAAIGLLFLAQGFAADKETTLEGKLVCTKCTLKEPGGCSHALKVTEKGKEVIYLVDDNNKNHDDVCPEGTELDAKVTGVVGEKAGKKILKNAKVTVKP